MLLFIEKIPDHGAISLSLDQVRHLKAKRIAQEGMNITLSDGHSFAEANLIQSSKGFVARYTQVRTLPLEIGGLTIFIGIIKPDRMGWLIEKAVEIGVKKIVPIWTERTQRGHWGPSTPAHLQKIIISACTQSMQLALPVLHTPLNLADALTIDTHDYRFYGSLATSEKTLCASTSGLNQNSSLSLWIGPEGGWSVEEEAILKQHATSIFYPGPILRAETAALVLSSFLLAQRQ